MPELIEKCIESQKEYCRKHNFEYELITLDSCYKGSRYIQECLNSPHRAGIKYCKASDYLRFYYLKEGYGIYLDADVFVPENSAGFEQLLNEQFVVGEEGCETIEGTIVLGTAILCSVKNHALLEKLLSVIETEFRGDTNDNYNSSMNLLNIYGVDYQHIMTLLPPDYFFPYQHQKNITRITDRTICIHMFYKAWTNGGENKESDLPAVSIIIPSLGNTERRKLGLQKCLDSIEQLNYPRHLIDIQIIEGQETVPQKVKKGVEQSKGELIVFASNDMEFTPDSLVLAVKESKNHGLVAFNTGEPEYDGNMCEHFLIRRNMLDRIGGEIFDCRYYHVGVDQLLWAKCSKLNEAIRLKEAVVIHNHFTRGGEFDEVYAKGWDEQRVRHDRILLLMDLDGLDGMY